MTTDTVHADENDMDIPDDAPEGNGPMGVSKFKTSDKKNEQGLSDSSDYDSDSDINKAYDNYAADWRRSNPGGEMPPRFETMLKNTKNGRKWTTNYNSLPLRNLECMRPGTTWSRVMRPRMGITDLRGYQSLKSWDYSLI